MENYRDKLAAELKDTPKDMRRAVLEEAKQSGDYIQAFYEHNKPKWDKRDAKREQKIKEKEPDLQLNNSLNLECRYNDFAVV